jgi:hypothetical protein
VAVETPASSATSLIPAISSPPLHVFLQQILQKILQDLQKYGKEAVIGNTCG